MNHPKREEWVPFLYGETRPQVERELKAHLDSCPHCRAELAAWQQGLGRLDAWKLPRADREHFLPVPILKWTAAAAALLLLGYSVGTFTAPKPDIQSIRATLEPQMRNKLISELAQVIRQEVNQAAATTLTHAEEQSGKAAALVAAKLESRHTQDYQELHAALLVLKQQLDTVAMNTDAGLRQAEQKLVQLADHKEPRDSSAQP